MKSMWKIFVPVLLAVLFLLPVGNPWAGSESAPPIKTLMGDNFLKMQTILMNLVVSNYSAIPKEIEEIRDHAVELSQEGTAGKAGQTNPHLFTVYAFTLESQANNMITVLKELIQHDRMQAEPGRLNIDYLRVVAARHYGEMITTCVLCHNQFRRQKVR